MRTIKWTTRFKRDFKRESKGQHKAALDAAMTMTIASLANDVPLPAHQRDHDLNGDWASYRECHIKPDLLLIYRKTDRASERSLILARLGSHNALFG
jgi:mRNA interferase YafQ